MIRFRKIWFSVSICAKPTLSSVGIGCYSMLIYIAYHNGVSMATLTRLFPVSHDRLAMNKNSSLQDVVTLQDVYCIMLKRFPFYTIFFTFLCYNSFLCYLILHYYVMIHKGFWHYCGLSAPSGSKNPAFCYESFRRYTALAAVKQYTLADSAGSISAVFCRPLP